MTYIDLIIGVVTANIILYLCKEILDVILQITEDNLLGLENDIFSGGRKLSNLYNKIQNNKKYKKFLKDIPDDHTYKGCTIKKISSKKWAVTTISWNNTEKLNLSNLYYHCKHDDSDIHDEVNELLNDYKKSQQFKKEMKEIANSSPIKEET